MKAAIVGNVEHVQYLVEHGAKTDMLNSVIDCAAGLLGILG